MLQWRLKLHEARRALADGRYEDALAVLNDPALKGFLPARRLADDLAEKYALRAEQRIEWGQSSAGFADLAAVDQLGAHRERADAIRREYARRLERQAIRRIVAGTPDSALALLRHGKRRGADSPRLRTLAELALHWAAALEQADAGDAPRASASLRRAKGALDAFEPADDSAALSESLRSTQEELSLRFDAHRLASERLRAAATGRDWAGVMSAADEALCHAPRDPESAGLRRRAWRELELGQTRAFQDSPREAGSKDMSRPPNRPSDARRLGRAIRDTSRAGSAAKSDTAAGRRAADRRMLWVDAVGGFLVCLDSEVVIGQPAGGATPDLPVLADLSRRHAIIRREQGAYVIEPVGSTKLDGAPLTGPAVLGAENLIELGGSVRVRFVRPHALSATARLTIESGHKTVPSSDAVLLMAESCVLGPGSHSHVRCKNWTTDLILFRQEGGLGCRSGAPLIVDGREVEGQATIAEASRLEGQDFAVSVELA